MGCPNKNLQEYKDLIEKFGKGEALAAFKLNDEKIPTIEEAEKLLDKFKEVIAKRAISEPLSRLERQIDIEENGKLKPAPFVFGSTITPPTSAFDESRVARTQQFFSNFNQIRSTMLKQKGRENSSLQMLVVTSNNVAKLGLDKVWQGTLAGEYGQHSLIDFLNINTSEKELEETGTPDRRAYDQTNPDDKTIATVAVEWDPTHNNGQGNPKGKYHFLNVKGERIENPTAHDLVINTLPTPSPTSVRTGRSRFPAGTTEAEQKQYIDQWKGKRAEMLANDGTQPILFNFDVSRGHPKRTPDPKDPTKWKQNPTVGSLVERGDLYDLGLVKIATDPSGITHQGENIPAKVGAVYLEQGGTLQFLNNRKLSTTQVEDMFHILKQSAKLFDDIHGISFKTTDEKQKAERDSFKDQLTKLTQYLQGVIYYGRTNDPRSTGKDFRGNKNQLYLKGSELLIGENKAGYPYRFPFTEETFNEDNPNNQIAEFKARLAELYTNANSGLLIANEPFQEMYTKADDKGKITIQTREWKTYQHYLLSDHYDLRNGNDKEQRHVDEIPFRTSVNMKGQGEYSTNMQGRYAKLRNKEEGSYMFVKSAKEAAATKKPEATKDPAIVAEKEFSAPVLDLNNTKLKYKIEDGKVVINAEDMKNLMHNLQNPTNPVAVPVMLQLVSAGPDETVKSLQEKVEKFMTTMIGQYELNMAEQAKKVSNTPAEDAQVAAKVEESDKAKEEEPKPAAPAKRRGGGNKGNARRMNSNELEFALHDIGTSEAWFNANVPFPGERLKTIIKLTDGGLAFGQYVGTHAEWYENAKRGTIEHEAFEGIWASFTAAKERAQIMEEFRSRKGEFRHHEDDRIIKYADASDYELKEQLAEELGHYVLDNKFYSAPKSTKSNFIARMFEDFVNFVKGLFDGSIKNYFKNINIGYYKTAPRLNEYTGTGEARKMTIGPLSIQDSSMVVKGVTSRLIQQLFADSKSLIEFDVKKYNAKDLLETVRRRMKSDFVNVGWDTEGKEYPLSYEESDPNSIESQYQDNLITQDQYEQHLRMWNNIDAHWDEIATNKDSLVKEYLKGMGIKHDSENETEVANNRDFQDVFSVDNNKSMSASMKLLFSTIVEQKWVDEVDEEGNVTQVLREKLDPSTNMPIPVNFSKLVNYVRSELTEFNTLPEKMEHLEFMAKFDPNIVKVVERLGQMKDVWSGDEVKIRAAFNNVFGKQRPEAITMYIHEDNNTNFSPQNLNASTIKRVAIWLDTLKGTVGEKGSPIQESNVPGEEGQYTFNGDRFKDAYGDVKISSKDKEEAITNQIEFLNSLGIDFTRDLRDKLSTVKEANQSESDLDKFVTATRALFDNLGKINVNEITAGNLKVAGRLRTLAELYLKASGEAESTFYNIDNKQQSQEVGPNFVHTISNDLNNSTSKDNFLQRLPHMAQPFRQGSIYLNSILFDGDKRIASKTLKPSYIQGRIDNRTGEDNKTVAEMSHPERLMFEINANLSKLYYILVPADSKTEWTLKMEHIVPWKSFHEEGVNDTIYDIFNNYYQVEKGIATGIDGKIDPKYKSLMHDLAGGYADENLNKDEFIKKLDDDADVMLQYLVKAGSITKAEGSEYYRIKNFNMEFVASNELQRKDKNALFTEDNLKKLLKFRNTNYMINNIEMFKIYFGDVAAIKDPLKRIKSFMSPRETMIYDDPKFNNTLNETLNKIKVGKTLELTNDLESGQDEVVDKVITLREGDYGYRKYTDVLKTVNFRDQDVVQVSHGANSFVGITEDARLLAGNAKAREILQDAYKSINPTDGSGFITLTGHREIVYKSGRGTIAHDKMYDYVLAKDRQLMYQDGHLQTEDANAKNYYRPEIKAYDEKRIKKMNVDRTLNILKPIYSGVDQTGNLVLDKYSLAPMTYEIVRGTPLEKLFLHMVEEGVHYAVADSGRKIGKNKLHDIYNEDGTLNEESPKDNTRNDLSFKYLGIQTETAGNHHDNSFGTQASTLVNLNTFDNAAPTDFDKKIGDWRKLSEADKIKHSERYRKFDHNRNLLKAMQDHGYTELLKKLGIVDNAETGGGFSIPRENMPKIEALLREELLRRDVSQNLKDALSFNEESGTWNTPLEAISNYKQIKDIIFSYVDKSIAKPKQNGGPKIMIPGIMVGSVNGKEIRTVQVKDKDGNYTGQSRLVSDGLKFYEAEYYPEGHKKAGQRKSVSRMEVIITSEVPKQMRSHERWKDATDEEIMLHLNENPELLHGIGFRIPTQEMNSLEAFVIKGFLPEYMGDSIVVPEAITAKAGSDFDVDKLNTYLKNVYLDKDGNAKAVPYLGTGEAALSQFREIATELKKTLKQEEVSKDVIDLPSEEMTEEEVEALENANASEAEKIESYAQKLYKQSLQNAYYDSLSEMILDPENYERLVKPNNAELLKGISKMLEKLAPNEFTADKTGSVLDPMFMSEARHAFITGKQDLSIAANNQKNHSINQLAQVVIEPLFKSRLSKIEQTFIGDTKILLPHNKTTVNYTYRWNAQAGALEKVPFEQGRALPTFSGVTDNKKQVISDNISQGIDGYADVAKGAWIMNIIQHHMISSTYFTMLKMGIDPETAGLFTNQPIIREFVKMLAKNDSTFMLKRVDSTERRSLFDMFPVDIPNRTAVEKKAWSINMQKAINERMKEGFDNPQFLGALPENIRSFYKDGQLSSKEKNLEQHAILQEFLKYKVISDHMFVMQEASTWDTKSMAEPNMQLRKRDIVEKARTSIIISSIDELLQANHLENLMKHVGQSSVAINESMFKIGHPIVRTYVKGILNMLPSRMSGDNYQRAAQAVEENLISFLVQNSDLNALSRKEYEGVTDKRYNERIHELLIDKKTSISARIKQLRKDLKNDSNSDIANSLFLKRLVVKTKKNVADIKNIFLSSKPTDSFSIDVLTDAMREFRDSTIPLKYKDLYNDILIASFLQSGLANSDISFGKYMPAEDYAKIVSPAINELVDNNGKVNSEEMLQKFYDSKDFFRNKWQDKKIVPQEKEIWDMNEDGSGKSKYRVSPDIAEVFKSIRERANESWSVPYAEKTAKTVNEYHPVADLKINSEEEESTKKVIGRKRAETAIKGNRITSEDHPKLKLMVHETEDGQFAVINDKTGREISRGATKKEAVDNATKIINKTGNTTKKTIGLTKRDMYDPNDKVEFAYRPYQDYIPFKLPLDNLSAQYDFITLHAESISNAIARSQDLDPVVKDPSYFLQKVRGKDGKEFTIQEGGQEWYLYVPISTKGDGRLLEEHTPDSPMSVLRTDGYQVPAEIPHSAIIEGIQEFYDDMREYHESLKKQGVTDEEGNFQELDEDGFLKPKENLVEPEKSGNFVEPDNTPKNVEVTVKKDDKSDWSLSVTPTGQVYNKTTGDQLDPVKDKKLINKALLKSGFLPYKLVEAKNGIKYAVTNDGRIFTMAESNMGAELSADSGIRKDVLEKYEKLIGNKDPNKVEPDGLPPIDLTEENNC
jgi:hypothetical protein